jgi:phage shock protein PspC (stress-responsive transcriptional regulator)
MKPSPQHVFPRFFASHKMVLHWNQNETERIRRVVSLLVEMLQGTLLRLIAWLCMRKNSRVVSTIFFQFFAPVWHPHVHWWLHTHLEAENIKLFNNFKKVLYTRFMQHSVAFLESRTEFAFWIINRAPGRWHLTLLLFLVLWWCCCSS